MSNENNMKKSIRIVVTLCLITALVGALLAFVNLMTKDRIAEQNQKAMDEAVAVIFGKCEAVEIEGQYDAPVSNVYDVKVAGHSVGYCVFVKPKGYGGAVEMMVGITPQGAVRGISIVSHSETPNLGTKVVENGSYLANYFGKTEPVTFGNGVEAVSGATRSSNAVRDGVNAALKLGLGKKNSATAQEG
ncbi:MAG: FMN-binding protein [Clostridia bacterium]|nr:FMN-binding protein [Clostridia bacterium]